MFHRFICRYCGKEKPWEERDYDMGLYLAQLASFEALGHIEGVTPYLICNDCSKEIKQNSLACIYEGGLICKPKT